MYGFIRSAVLDRGNSCRKTSRYCQLGTTFSMPMTEMSTFGKVRHIRPFPSDSTMQIVPVSATAKLPPLIATGTLRNFLRRGARAAAASARGSSLRSSVSVSRRRKIARISARFLWIAGTRIWLDRSSASWMMSSARSVSIASMPCSASASFRPISSVVSDLILTTSFAACASAIPAMMALASAASAAQCTCPPARVTACSSWRR